MFLIHKQLLWLPFAASICLISASVANAQEKRYILYQESNEPGYKTVYEVPPEWRTPSATLVGHPGEQWPIKAHCENKYPVPLVITNISLRLYRLPDLPRLGRETLDWTKIRITFPEAAEANDYLTGEGQLKHQLVVKDTGGFAGSGTGQQWIVEPTGQWLRVTKENGKRVETRGQFSKEALHFWACGHSWWSRGSNRPTTTPSGYSVGPCSGVVAASAAIALRAAVPGVARVRTGCRAFRRFKSSEPIPGRSMCHSARR